jgi:predicted solute-binding protein
MNNYELQNYNLIKNKPDPMRILPWRHYTNLEPLMWLLQEGCDILNVTIALPNIQNKTFT